MYVSIKYEKHTDVFQNCYVDISLKRARSRYTYVRSYIQKHVELKLISQQFDYCLHA